MFVRSVWLLGAIKIIPLGGGYRTVSPNATRGREGVSRSVRDIVSKVLNHIFAFWFTFSKEKRLVKKINVTSHRGGNVTK